MGPSSDLWGMDSYNLPGISTVAVTYGAPDTLSRGNGIVAAGPEGPPGRPEAWRCRKCGASVPNNLATCPKCGAGR